MTNPAGVDHRHTNEINKLLLDQLLAVINRVKDFPDRKRRSRVLAYQSKTLLQFRRRGIFQPKQSERFQLLAQSRRFNRSQTMMSIVQNMDLRSELLAQSGQQLRHKSQV